MTETVTRTEQLLAELRELELPEDLPVRAGVRRRQVVGRMRELVVEPPSRRAARGRAAWALVAAAAALVLALGGIWLAMGSASTGEATAAGELRALGGQTELIRAGQVVPLVEAGKASLALLDVVRTAGASGAELETAHGVTVRVAGATEVQLVPDPVAAAALAERVELVSGRIDVDVPEDGMKRVFSVVTPDAVVTVHGTKFVVAIDGEHRTRVRVERGVVAVRSSQGRTLLRAGGVWTSSESAAARGEVGAVAAVVPLAARPSDVRRSPEAPSEPEATTRAETTLPEENRAYQAAMRAKLAGRDGVVVERLQRFLGEYPRSPLVPDAQIELFRALRRLGRGDEASRSARRYLANNPDGFAREEARAAALAEPSEPSVEKK